MSWVGVGVAGAGALSSIGGGILSGNSAKRAATTQSQSSLRLASAGQHALGNLAYGGSYDAFTNKLYAAVAKAVDHGDMTDLNNLSSSPEAAAYAKATGKPIIQQIRDISNASNKSDFQQLNDYDQESAQLDREGQAPLKMAAKYGTDQNAVIDNDARKALGDANALSMARLNSTGLGASTMTTDAMGQNASRVFSEASRNKANVADRATGMKIQASEGAIGRKYQRSNERLGQYNTIRNRVNSNRLMAPQAQLGLQTGGTLNLAGAMPMGASGESAGVNALGAAGSSLGTVGGLLLARNSGSGINGGGSYYTGGGGGAGNNRNFDYFPPGGG